MRSRVSSRNPASAIRPESSGFLNLGAICCGGQTPGVLVAQGCDPASAIRPESSGFLNLARDLLLGVRHSVSLETPGVLVAQGGDTEFLRLLKISM